MAYPRLDSKSALTQEALKEILDYDPETGRFTWVKPYYNRRLGEQAGTFKRRHGYVSITISRHDYGAHRLAWLYVHGHLPAQQIDHINGDRTDNRIANLRECTHAENCQNRAPAAGKHSQFMGVTWNKMARKWQANIGVNSRSIYLGIFEVEADAAAAYAEAKVNLHKFNPVNRGIAV